MRALDKLCSAIVLTTAALPAFGLDGVPEFAVTRIGGELAPLRVSFARGLNENGDAVGEIWFTGFRQAFVYTYEQGPLLLPFVESHPHARAFDVSDRDVNGDVIIAGVAAGSFYDEVGVAVYWKYSTLTGQVLETVEIGTLPGDTQSFARAVNNDGLIIGYSGFQPIVYDVTAGTLEAFTFPTLPTDINNLGQVVGGSYRGDLDGNAEDLGHPPTSTGVGINAINDLGWVVGTASMPFTDGAGWFVNGNARYTDTWQLFYANSRFDGGSDLNNPGDVVGSLGISAAIRPVLIVESTGTLHFLNDLIAPDQPFFLESALAINDAGQIAGGNQAVLLTPLGTMIIPGDVTGNAIVDKDDLCAWQASPIDLDGDGDGDADDEQWLLDRLATLGFVVNDCNGNGAADHCDIASGTSADCNENDVADECEPDCDSNGVPDACEPDCNGNGVPDPCDVADGTSEDCNGNGVPDECDGSDVVTYDNPFDPPVFLLQDDTYQDDLLTPGGGTVADADVTLDIDYRIGNLTVRLAHAGVTITLIDRPGHPQVIQGNGQLGYRITLDDEGTGGAIENQGNFGSPFEPITSPPSYQPDEALSAFDGLPLDGLWTIEVITTSFSPVSDLLAWGLVVTDEAVPVGECTCKGDFDGSGAVGFGDLSTLLAAWGTCAAPCPHDLDGSGDVGFADLGTLLAAWGACAAP